ncbi:MAG: flagellar biosynthesis protein FlgA, partial [Corynebacterium sp.]|nr:flagellar biosynthesis protein FlgA [Corynebacterium sp.]
VLLALPHDHANDVAAASLSQPLTVVIVGDRAHPQQH